MTLNHALQGAILLLVPVAAAWGARKSALLRAISPVVLCYAVGILLANQRWIVLSEDLSLKAAFGSAWRRQPPTSTPASVNRCVFSARSPS